MLKITNYTIKRDDAKAIGKFISEKMTIKELDFSNSVLSTDCAKEIADGLMRAKNIEILKLGENPNFDCT
jgi:Ran GTPase-activating protein (RanGAP) involved in mRNA processing and transport